MKSKNIMDLERKTYLGGGAVVIGPAIAKGVKTTINELKNIANLRDNLEYIKTPVRPKKPTSPKKDKTPGVDYTPDQGSYFRRPPEV